MDRGMQMYGEILQADPKNWQAFRGRGDLYLTNGKQREAISDFEQALSLKADDSGVLNNLAWVLATSPDAALRMASDRSSWRRRPATRQSTSRRTS